MDNPVTTFDLEPRWRPLTAAETLVGTAFLSDAWSIIETNVGDLDAKFADGRITLASIKRVVCAAVLRVLKNPEGWREVAIDDFHRVRDTALSAGELYISPEELAGLETAGSADTREAFSIRPGVPNQLHHFRPFYPCP